MRFQVTPGYIRTYGTLIAAFWCLTAVPTMAQEPTVVQARSGVAGSSTASTLGTTITWWHPKRLTFSQTGTPQRWVNILGNVSDPVGVGSLTYTLNGGSAVALSMGPDTRRLSKPGDFNIDILYRSLRPLPDSNIVALTARNTSGTYTRDTVVVRYLPGTVWPRVTDITWGSASCLYDSVQMVDGDWSVVPGGVHCAAVGYDRLLAFGDTTWKDYEITVPITIHGVDPAGYGPINGRPVVGVFVGWSGHSDDPLSGWQPKSGWKPFGVAGLYEFDSAGSHLTMYDKFNDGSGKQIPFDVPYYFKIRAQSNSSGVLYSFKVWDVNTSEPSVFDMTWQSSLSDPRQGAAMLCAHFVDATFGAIKVRPITGDNVPPVLSGLTVSAGLSSAVVQWQTDEPARGRIEFGKTSTYGTIFADANLTTGHSFTLNGLTSYTTYHYRVFSYDESGNTATSGDMTFNTGNLSTVVSDEFNVQPIDSSLWTIQDPVGDVSVTVTGGALSVALPQGTEHTVFSGGTTLPRILQPANDKDMDVQAKLAVGVSQPISGAGIIVDGSATDYVRFELYSDGSSTRALAEKITSNVPSTVFDIAIGANGISPLWLRLQRERNTWTGLYSLDGTTWNTAGQFDYTLTVHHVGLTARNAGAPPPDYSAMFDYFRSAIAPIPRPKLPANGASGLGVNVTTVWHSSYGAARYHVQVSVDSTFVTGLVVNDSTLTDTTRALTGLTTYTRYHWRVASSNTGGKSPFSARQSFTTYLPLPNQVTLVAPANLAKPKADSVLCLWHRNQKGESKYWLELSEDSLFIFPGIDSSLTDTTKMLRGLALNQWHYWRVRAGNASGWGPYSEMRRFYASLTDVAFEPTLPKEVSLAQNYPNPFNPTTILEYGLPAESRVRLEVFNTLGQRVTLLVDEIQPAGYHRQHFTADGLSTGVLFYRLSVNNGEHVFVKRMLVVR
jgi:hypothetical protein